MKPRAADIILKLIRSVEDHRGWEILQRAFNYLNGYPVTNPGETTMYER